jgi:hypothetical protein
MTDAGMFGNQFDKIISQIKRILAVFFRIRFSREKSRRKKD